jgi:hypothetical protein
MTNKDIEQSDDDRELAGSRGLDVDTTDRTVERRSWLVKLFDRSTANRAQ